MNKKGDLPNKHGKQKAVTVSTRNSVFKTVPVDLTDKIKLVLDNKTTIYVEPGKDIEKVKQKWLRVLKPQKVTRLKDYIPVK